MLQIYITVKSFEWYHIQNTIMFINKIQLLLNLKRKIKFEKSNQITLPKKRKLFTVLRSPHIDKKSREQFILKKHKKKIILHFDQSSIYSIFLYFLKNSQFSGVEIEIIAQNSTFFIEPSTC